MMRFHGGGVGHTSTREATNRFLVDRHTTDMTGQLEDAADASAGEPEPLNDGFEEVPRMDAMDDDTPDDEEPEGGNEEDDYDYRGAGNSEEEQDEEGGDMQDTEEGLEISETHEDDDSEMEGEVEQLGYARY